MNLDGLGGTDFFISVRRHTNTANIHGFARFGSWSYPNRFIINGSNNVANLAAGATISAAQSFGSGDRMRRFFNGVAAAGTWGDGDIGFAGVAFVNGADTYYGWVRLQWTDSADGNPDPNTVTAIDWAYNDTPDGSILAGQGAAVPEPSRALLALAGLGAMALRRRRKVA